MRFEARLRGSGSADIEAYGTADAEARLRKELTLALPDAEIDVRALRRVDESPRIVESFLIEYRLDVVRLTEGANEESARRMAFADARRALHGTRFERVAWQSATLTPA